MQDPFVLNHNITQNINEKRLIHLVQEFAVAAKKCEVWKGAVSHKSFIDLLQDDIPGDVDLDALKKNLKNTEKSKKKKDVLKDDLFLGEYQFAIEMKTENLHADLLSWLSEQDDCQKAWLQHTCAYLYLLWEQVLMFDCEIINHNLPYTPQKSREYCFRRRPTIKRAASNEKTGTCKKINTGNKVKAVSEEAGKEGDEADMELCTGEKEETAEEQPREYDTSNFLEEEVHMDIEMKVFCKTWAERKKMGQTLKATRGHVDGVLLEKTISETLYYEKPGKENLPIIQSQVIITSACIKKKRYLIVDFKGDRRQGMLFPVFRFVKKFTEQMVKSFLHELY